MSSLLAELDTASNYRRSNVVRYPPVIGLSGFAGSGKDTVGDALGAYGYTPLSFTDPIREGLLILDPIVAVTSYGNTFGLAEYIDENGWRDAKDNNPLVRPLMERFGDALKALFGEDIFVRTALAKVEPYALRVVTDVRYDFEAEAIREHGGVIIRIDRPGKGATTGHSSDRVVSPGLVDFVLRNDGALQELPSEIANVMTDVADWMDR